MSAHELKTDPYVFEAMVQGFKTCEVRNDDRGYRVGDTLVLRETRYSNAAMKSLGKPLEYTGRTLTRTVSHVLRGYGLQPSTVALSFAPTADAESDAALIAELDQLRLEVWRQGSRFNCVVLDKPPLPDRGFYRSNAEFLKACGEAVDAFMERSVVEKGDGA